jgi:DeoR/GlpR family transcriptional regulator of sugar metabolism
MSAPVLLCPHDRITTLVTDAEPDHAAADHLRSTGTRIIVAGR